MICSDVTIYIGFTIFFVEIDFTGFFCAVRSIWLVTTNKVGLGVNCRSKIVAVATPLNMIAGRIGIIG